MMFSLTAFCRVHRLILPIVGEIANVLPLRIGIETDNGYPWKGGIDEMVVAYSARSADWVKLCYMNQKTSDALVVFK